MTSRNRTLFFAKTSGLAALAGLLLAASAPVQAAITHYSGTICQPDWNGVGSASYAYLGATNAATSGSKLKVTCPIPVTNAPYVTQVDFYLIDQNPNAGQSVDCYLHGVNTGSGISFLLTVPATTTTTPTPVQKYVNPNTTPTFMVAECYIPHRIGAYDYSWILDIAVQTSP